MELKEIEQRDHMGNLQGLQRVHVTVDEWVDVMCKDNLTNGLAKYFYESGRTSRKHYFSRGVVEGEAVQFDYSLYYPGFYIPSK